MSGSTNTVSSLLSVYQDCTAKGENVTLYMEAREGKQVVSLSVELPPVLGTSAVTKHENNEETSGNVEKHVRDEKENEKKKKLYKERIIFPAQYSGPISCQKAAEKLRKKWPLTVVKKLMVRKTSAGFDEKCGLEHLEVVADVEAGVDF